MENENKSLIEQAVEHMNEMSAKAHYKKYQNKFKVPPIDKSRYPNKEKQGLEGPYRSKKSGKIFYYDKKAGKYYDTDSDMYLSVDDVMESVELDEAKAEDYKLKKTKKEVDKQDDEDDIITQHYDVMLKGKKVGTAEEDDYYGYVDATIHGKTIPSLSGRGSAERQIQKYLKSKRGSKIIAEVVENPEYDPDLGEMNIGEAKEPAHFAKKRDDGTYSVLKNHPRGAMGMSHGHDKATADRLVAKHNKSAEVRSRRDAGIPDVAGKYKGQRLFASKKNEEVEQVDEKKKKVSSFRDMINRVAGDAVKAGEKRREERGKDSSGHVPGKIRFGKREESVEQIDELDAKTLIRYNNAASQQVTRDTKTDTGKVTPKTVKRLKGALKARKKLDKIMPGLRQETISDEDAKRMGIEQPLKGKGFPYNEDVEQVDELKKSTIMNYKDRAKAQRNDIARRNQSVKGPLIGKDADQYIKRGKGVDKATKKLVARQYDEEVELDELKMPAKDAEGRIKDPTIRKAYKQGQRIADLKADKKLRNKDAEGAEGHLKRSQERRAKSRNEEVDLDEAPKIKVKLNPEKKIGYKIQSVGPGGKKITTKMRDWPGKKDIGETHLDKSNPEPTAKEMDKARDDKEYDKQLDAIRAKKNK